MDVSELFQDQDGGKKKSQKWKIAGKLPWEAPSWLCGNAGFPGKAPASPGLNKQEKVGIYSLFWDNSAMWRSS